MPHWATRRVYRCWPGYVTGSAIRSLNWTHGTRLSRQAVTKHLQVLERVRMVHRRQEGRESLFTFDPHPVIEMQEYLELVSKQWDLALGRLKKLVEAHGE